MVETIVTASTLEGDRNGYDRSSDKRIKDKKGKDIILKKITRC